ncbi:MAG: type VI secretion system baseplate subunit TssG [Opitutaceae bacterium]
MADTDGDAAGPVGPPEGLAGLLDNPGRYDFFGALRLIQTRMAMPSIGTAIRPGEERLRLAQDPSLGFAPTAMSGAAWDPERERLSLKLCFSGLLGPNGPMPMHLTEYIIDRRRHSDDPTLEQFLNLFHHRFYSLLYRAWALNQPTVDFEEKGGRRFSHYVACLAGLGTAGAAEPGQVTEAARLFYSGWMGGLGRSAAGLGAILSDFLAVSAEVRSFQGMWLELPEDSRCRLGASPSTGVLGSTCIAGERAWVSHLKFRIRMGPLTWKEYESLLPGGRAFAQLAEWVRSYIGEEFFWELQLVLRGDHIPEARLGGIARLGWSTWLGRPADCEVVDDLIAQCA